mgnify:CR=1 FL=1
MSAFKFSRRSLNNMYGVHPNLIRIAYRALELTDVDFGITEGLRSIERQRELLEQGKSQTMNSYHLPRFGDKYGRAIDIACYVDGKLTWDFDVHVHVSKFFKQAAEEYGYKITWGGDWTTLRDGPHYQLEDN